ncbi:hypothetical protein IGI37_002287 [Enterococcus sp. AZ194]|uniref:hypothetical protein n=1 Tax=Enterococcus sp. AZ194 TaxID=2774629 RepID=UPI003F255408
MIIKLDRTGFKRRLWERAFYKALRQYETDFDNKESEDILQQDAEKIVVYGIKFLGPKYKEMKDSEREALEHQWELYSVVMKSIQAVTPRQFMEWFRIKKDFDGKRWECKDYFSTMEALQEVDIDKPIKEPFEFLWDYWNRDTSRFLINYMSAISNLRKLDTGIGIVEEYFQNEGLTFYEE